MSDYLFVTGKLAADALMPIIKRMEPDFEYEVAVLNISVAALMDTRWIARHLSDARGYDQVMIPGYCPGDLSIIEDRVGVSVIRGPKDLKDLPVFFGHERILEGYGEYRVKILAEIVEAYQMPWDRILAMAEYYRANGADIIDLGCPPQGGFPGGRANCGQLHQHQIHRHGRTCIKQRMASLICLSHTCLLDGFSCTHQAI